MNFFKEQELARQRLARFNYLFMTTVLLTAVFSSVVVHLYFLKHRWSSDPSKLDLHFFLGSPVFWNLLLFFILFILGFAWWKKRELGDGGDHVALMMGGKRLSEIRDQESFKVLQNIVEEMSIAAGIIPPQIYILSSEENINAFAAGKTINDAVIGVSIGCLKNLNRDELQGVVAHEIGHIVNGDMKLNIDIISLLHGLMGIFYFGRAMVRSSSSRSSGRGKSNPLMGFPIMLIGLGGYFIGTLLRFAISRDQEFAADARAVQFTRNPLGIGGALKKILAGVENFKIDSAKGSEVAHMWFYYPRSIFFATHPPIETRISKILPSFKFNDFKRKEKRLLTESLEKGVSDALVSPFYDSSVNSEFNIQQDIQLEKQAIGFFRAIASHNKTSPEFNLEYMQHMNLLLSRVRNLHKDRIRPLMEKLKSIVKADSRLTARELLCFALFKEILMPKQKVRKASCDLKKIENELQKMMSFLAKVSSDSPQFQKESFDKGISTLFPNKQLLLTSSYSTQDVLRSFEACQALLPLEKEKLMKAVSIVLEHQKSFNFNGELVKKVLAEIMGIPHTEV
jgi:Zn-dependent protease with chaperone function